jgi:hypothetical protein
VQSETGFPFAVDASAKEEDRVCLLARTMFVADSEKAKAYPLQVCRGAARDWTARDSLLEVLAEHGSLLGRDLACCLVPK